MYICGLDEVGRGALAGPMMAVASLFHLPDNWTWSDVDTHNSPIPGVNDSKKLTATKRRDVFHHILRSNQIIDFGIGEVSVTEIDNHGIEWANRQAFERAVKELRIGPNYILVDGDHPLYGWDMRLQHNEPKADGRWWPVGAASILAKVIRDSFMAELGRDFPRYQWASNAGYGSDAHQLAIIENGPCNLHRRQFVRKFTRSTP